MSLNRRSLIAIFSATGLIAILIYFGGSSVTKFFSRRSLDLKAPPPQSIFTSIGTSARIIKVSIDYDKVESDDKIAEVTARLIMPFDFNRNMSFRWKLGEGVQLVDGAEDGILQGLRADEEIEIKIKVKGFSLQQNHNIGFEINGALNGQFVHGDALIASDLENTFENTVQNVERIKASQ